MLAEFGPELFAFSQIVFIDLLMAGDNAIVVGLAAAGVPVAERKKVIIWGTAAAVGLRIAFALVATQLLAIVGLTLAGGILLAWVAYKMYREITSEKDEAAILEAEAANKAVGTPKTVRAAIWTIVLADISMSLDNVLAVAGVAKDHLGMLVLGLLLSVVLMAFAANYIAQMIHRHRWVAWIGLVVIAFVAVKMIVEGAEQVVHVIG